MNGYLSITHHTIPKYFYLLFNLFASVLRLTLNKLNTNFFFFGNDFCFARHGRSSKIQ